MIDLIYHFLVTFWYSDFKVGSRRNPLTEVNGLRREPIGFK
jgi:hypothetical protein